MIVNAYKINFSKPEICDKTDSEIIKEVTECLIKEYSEFIEDNDKVKLQEVIKRILYENYFIKDASKIVDLNKQIIDKIFGYGILQKHIENTNVSDIRVVAFNEVYVKEKGKWKRTEETFESKEKFEEYVRFCVLKNNANINFETPIVIFSDRKNSLRIEAGIEPANITGPSLVIRIHRKNIKSNLEELFVKHNMLDKNSYQIIKQKIGWNKNIILCGKGGSGKTTLLKALVNRIPEEMAITTNEETAEMFLNHRNVIQRECILNRTSDKNIDLELLSKHALVMSNDVIIIGELKGSEANSFFDSISTGHVGMATVHSDSAINAIDRLITLIKKDVKAQYYTEEFLRAFLASSIDYIVFMKDFKVNEIEKIIFNSNTKSIEYKSIYSIKEK